VLACKHAPPLREESGGERLTKAAIRASDTNSSFDRHGSSTILNTRTWRGGITRLAARNTPPDAQPHGSVPNRPNRRGSPHRNVIRWYRGFGRVPTVRQAPPRGTRRFARQDRVPSVRHRAHRAGRRRWRNDTPPVPQEVDTR